MPVCNGVWNGMPCDRTAIHGRGKCFRCYHRWLADVKANGSYMPYEKALDDEIQKREPWTYENPEGEAELIEQQEQKNAAE